MTAGPGPRRVVLWGAGMGLGLIVLEAGLPRGFWSGLAALFGLVPVGLALAVGGVPAAALAILLALAGVTAMTGAPSALAVLLRTVLPGLVLGGAVARRLSLPATLVLVSTTSLVGLALLLWWLVPAGTTPLAFLRQQIEGQITELEGLPGRLGLEGEPASLKDAARVVATVMRVAAPGVILLGLFLGAAVNYVVVRTCLRGQGFRPFATETVPDHLVWWVIGGGLFLASGLTVGHEPLTLIGLNVLIVVAPLYAIQGLAVLRHFFQRANVPRLVQLLGFALFVFHPFLLLPAACVGLSDLWIDFRRIRGTPTPA